MSKPPGLVGVVMGSESDWFIMKEATLILNVMGIRCEKRIISAHRTPDELFTYAEHARNRLYAIIAGAGGAAHLPGMLAAKTKVPVLGVPIPSTVLNGMDSLLSIVQMPAGVPVATFAIGIPGAINAAIFVSEMMASSYPHVDQLLDKYRNSQKAHVAEANAQVGKS